MKFLSRTFQEPAGVIYHGGAVLLLAHGMKMWRERNAGDASLIFLCELGPPPYAITDANGEELSDRWQEALLIRRWVEEIWARFSWN